ncbi:MAG: transposase domain-containing protein [Pseudonocardiaceae bacterium]
MFGVGAVQGSGAPVREGVLQDILCAGAALSVDSVITRVLAVAGGRFAPGHVGELTRIVPFEMVDAALVEAGKLQARVRDLPARVVVYLLLAAGLFAEIGYEQVRARMIAGLDGLAVATPTGGAGPGAASARGRTIDGAVGVARRLGRGPGHHGRALAWAAGRRHRRHNDVLPGQRGEPAGVPPGRGPSRRYRVSDDPAAGPGRVWHPAPGAGLFSFRHS